MGDGTKVNGAPVDNGTKKKFHEQKWVRVAAVIGAVATLVTAVTGFVGSLGLDKLIERRTQENTTTAKVAYEELKLRNEQLSEALRKTLHRMERLDRKLARTDDRLDDVEDDIRIWRWMNAGHPWMPRNAETKTTGNSSPKPAKSTGPGNLFGLLGPDDAVADSPDLAAEIFPVENTRDWQQIQQQAQQELEP
jgi:hypothetical protein